MNQLTRLASKLYPRWWRERYGEEFAALLEDARPGFGGTIDILRGALTMQVSTFSAKRTLLLGALVGLVMGLAGTLLLAPQYSSHAVISVAAADGLGVVDAINQTSQAALSRVQLYKIVLNLDLYREERQRIPLEDVLEGMKRNIRVTASGPAVGGSVPGFELSFSYSDQATAQKVTNALVSAYLDANLRTRNSTMEILSTAALPAEPVPPARAPFALIGMSIGLLLSGGLTLIVHWRSKRQPAA